MIDLTSETEDELRAAMAEADETGDGRAWTAAFLEFTGRIRVSVMENLEKTGESDR